MLKGFIAACQFLTFLPIPVRTNTHDLKKGIVWFPVIGALIGILCGFLFMLLTPVIDINICSVMVILFYIFITRGLHLDGYMDTIDGFSSNLSAAKRLEIMKESTVGGFAILGVGIWFLIMFSVVPHLHFADFVTVHILSRTCIVIMPLFFTYARKKGKASFFFSGQKLPSISSLLFSLGLLALIDWQKLWVVPLAILVSLLIGLWSSRKIGGITGDVLGFVVETNHLLLLLILAIINRS